MIKPKNTVRIWCCGGGGINIGTMVESYRADNNPAFANFKVSYIDTSDANIATTQRDENSVYRFKSTRPNETVNGSGGIRRTNAELIIENVDDILLKHPAEDMNIVCFTASGASGSTVGPSLVSELLARGKFVIAMVIGDTQTNNRTKNTASTLKSLVAISQMRKSNVAIYYDENSESRSRDAVNLNMVSTFTSFLALFSGNNAELDNEDLYNWINYTRLVPGMEPELVRIEVVGASRAELDVTPVTVATLTSASSGDRTGLKEGHVPEEQFVGYLSNDVPTEILNELPVHFMTVNDSDELLANVLKKVSRVDEVRKASQTPRMQVLSENENVMSNGLILD